MNCFYHPQVAAVRQCQSEAGCAKGMCNDCDYGGLCYGHADHAVEVDTATAKSENTTALVFSIGATVIGAGFVIDSAFSYGTENLIDLLIIPVIFIVAWGLYWGWKNWRANGHRIFFFWTWGGGPIESAVRLAISLLFIEIVLAIMMLIGLFTGLPRFLQNRKIIAMMNGDWASTMFPGKYVPDRGYTPKVPPDDPDRPGAYDGDLAHPSNGANTASRDEGFTPKVPPDDPDRPAAYDGDLAHPSNGANTASRDELSRRWQEVIEALEAINALQPSDDVNDRLAEARRKLRITELQNVVRVYAANRNWKAVLAADNELTQLDPEAGDPDSLASKARAELLDAELAASRAQGVKHLEEHGWTDADEATFRVLLQRRASYREAEVVGRPTGMPPAGREEEYEQVEEPQKSRVGLVLPIGVLIMVALAIGGWGLYRMFNTAALPWRVQVPNVLTYTEQQARDKLAANNLRVEKVEKVNGDEETMGTITAQDPVANTVVLTYSKVTITLNEGPKTATIPEGLVGQDANDVVAALKDLGFWNVNSVAGKSEDPAIKPGEVISISRSEGATIPLDREITVWYATM
jgi:PASTA domain-containing protein